MHDWLSKLEPVVRNATRIMVGLAFWTHGAQKLLGWFGGVGASGGPAVLMSRFGVAGVLEFFGGLMVVFGIFHRPVAFVLAGEMAVAYWWRHVFGNDSLWWWANRGELALLYCFIFLFIAAVGGGHFSIDGLLKRRGNPSD